MGYLIFFDHLDVILSDGGGRDDDKLWLWLLDLRLSLFRAMIASAQSIELNINTLESMFMSLQLGHVIASLR